MISEILKKLIAEPRPPEACVFIDSVSYGNPSDMSAIVTTFLIAYLVLF